MAKPSSPTNHQKAKADPPPDKLYVYGKLTFGVYRGGQPPRHFNVKWTNEKSWTDDGVHQPEPTEDAKLGSRTL